jgi:VanZ family protein
VKSTQHLLGHNFFKIAAIFWTLLIFYLCLNDIQGMSKVHIENIDKLVHFGFYFVFVFLWLKSLKKITFYYLLFVFFIALALGICIEILQENFTKNRAFDWFDIIANTIGIVSSLFFVSIYNTIQKKRISQF